MKAFSFALAFMIIEESCFSFVLHPQNIKLIPSTRNNLVPEQATQLVAASTASLANKGIQQTEENTLLPEITGENALDIETSENDKRGKNGNVATARSFISKIFNSPSHQGKEDYGFGALSSQLFQNTKDKDENILLFPIVGFRWVAVDDANAEGKKRYVTIPTSCNASCNFKANLQTRTEETFGWFSPCCKVDDIDDKTLSN